MLSFLALGHLSLSPGLNGGPSATQSEYTEVPLGCLELPSEGALSPNNAGESSPFPPILAAHVLVAPLVDRTDLGRLMMVMVKAVLKCSPRAFQMFQVLLVILLSPLLQPCKVDQFYYPHITDERLRQSVLPSEFVAEMGFELGTSWVAAQAASCYAVPTLGAAMGYAAALLQK